MLTTKEHLGTRPDEPHKADAQEALKVGRPKAGPPVETVEVSTHESGEATDTVVINPSGEGLAGGAQAHQHDAVGIGLVRAEVSKQSQPKGKGAKSEGPAPLPYGAVRMPEILGKPEEQETVSTPAALGEANEEGKKSRESGKDGSKVK